MKHSETSSPSRAPLTSHRAMFAAEVEQATEELRRPGRALFASGIMAGASIGFVVLLLGTMVTLHQVPEGPAFRLSVGAIYAIGFTLAILGRTDLFTEYTTIATFPLLTGDAGVGSVARLWLLIYAGNICGGFIIALLGVVLGPALSIFASDDLADFARHLADHVWWVIVLSGAAAGWLMGVLSWLIAGGRDTTSQIIFIWIIGVMIGFLGLHHAITGGIEMMVAAIGSPQVTLRDILHVLVWTTLGNTIGGILFAVAIQQAVRMGDPQTDRTHAALKNGGRPKNRRETER